MELTVRQKVQAASGIFSILLELRISYLITSKPRKCTQVVRITPSSFENHVDNANNNPVRDCSPRLNILLVCRQARDEATQMLYREEPILSNERSSKSYLALYKY